MAPSQDSMNIELRFVSDLKELGNQLNYAKALIERRMADISKSVSKSRKGIDPGEWIHPNTTAVSTNVLKSTSPIIDLVKRTKKKIGAEFQDINRMFLFDIDTKPQMNKFKGWAMSIMFAGMALQRMSTQLYQFGTKAFNEIKHSVEGTVTASDRLDGSMKYLGYTIGEAIEPVAEMLIPIIDGISEWASENEGVVSSLTVAAGILGTLAMAGGSIALAKDGFNDMLKTVGLIKKDFTSMQVLSIGVGLYMAADAYDKLKDGEILTGAASALEAAGFMAFAGGNKKSGAALIGIGVALNIVDMVANNKTLTKDSIGALLIQAGAGVFMLNPIAGGAIITIGVALSLVSDTFLQQMLTVGEVMVDILAVIGGAIVDILLAPLRLFIDSILWIHNMLYSEQWSNPMGSYTAMSSAAYKEMMKDAAGYHEIGKQPEVQQTAPYKEGYSSMDNPASVVYINNNYMSGDNEAIAQSIMRRNGFVRNPMG